MATRPYVNIFSVLGCHKPTFFLSPKIGYNEIIKARDGKINIPSPSPLPLLLSPLLGRLIHIPGCWPSSQRDGVVRMWI